MIDIDTPYNNALFILERLQEEVIKDQFSHITYRADALCHLKNAQRHLTNKQPGLQLLYELKGVCIA
jgi:hypothetical protein